MRRRLRIEDGRVGGGIYHTRVVFIGSGVDAKSVIAHDAGPDVRVPEWASVFRVYRANYKPVYGRLSVGPHTLVRMTPERRERSSGEDYAPRPPR